MITRKIAAAILSAGCAAMMIPAVSVSGETYSGECGENLTWTIDEEGTITISGEGAMYDYARNDYTYNPDDILKEIENHTVSPFAYYGGSKLVIEEGVTHIGDNSFVGLLESVSFPSSLRSIGYGAFALSFLTEFTLPEGLEKIGDDAFWSNMSLRTVQLPESLKKIGAWAFCQCGFEDVINPHRRPPFREQPQYAKAPQETDVPAGLLHIFCCFGARSVCRYSEYTQIPHRISVSAQSFFFVSLSRKNMTPKTVTKI